MIELCLVGIGTGNPAHVTMQAITKLQSTDIIIVPRKGEMKSDLADLRHHICETLLGDNSPPLFEFDLPVRDDDKSYLSAVDEWHDAIAAVWQDAIAQAQDQLDRPVSSVGLLIWGDPSLYDSSLRIASRFNPQPHITMIPGITSVQALTAGHKIPVNEIGKPFMVTTGRQLRDRGFPNDADTIIVMLDGHCGFQTLEKDLYHIWWGAYLGMENELLIEGPLGAVCDKIIETRQSARAAHGWLMDCYMLQRLTQKEE